MFLSKGVFPLTNSVSKVFCENLIPCRFFSAVKEAVQPSTEMPVPDKLYKKIEVEVRGNDPAVLKSYADFSVMAARNLRITVGRNETSMGTFQRENVTGKMEQLSVTFFAKIVSLPSAYQSDALFIALDKPVHERLTVLKCVHIYKKHRVQYETRTYFRYLDFMRLTGSTADTFMEYLQRNLPEGVAMKVTKIEIRRLLESVQPQDA